MPMKFIKLYKSAKSKKSVRPIGKQTTQINSTVFVPNIFSASTRSNTVGPAIARTIASDMVIKIATAVTINA